MAVIPSINQLLSSADDYKVAVDGNLSYNTAQFQCDVARCIQSLKYGVEYRDEKSYLLFAQNSYHFAVNFIALLLLQKDIVLSANHKPDWLRSIDHAFDGIISDSDFTDTIPATHFSTQRAGQIPALPTPSNLASSITFFTSGSSDKPKAISKSFEQLFKEIEVLESTFCNQVDQCQFIASVSHHHIYGLIFRLLWPLLSQRTFNTDIILYPEQLVDLVNNDSRYCLISSPAFLSRQDQSLPTLSLNACFSSGSLLSESASLASSQQLGLFPIEVFGSTETGGIGYRSQAEGNSTWTFFPGINIDVKQQQALLRSPYLNQPYQLDDKIELVEGNQFLLLGRQDRVVKIEEKRVSLDALERSLEKTEWVNKAKVLVLQQQRMFVAAVIELTPKGLNFLQHHRKHELNNHLRSQLQDQFEAVAIPRKWRYLEQLPYNSQGKIPLDSLKELFA